MEDKIDKDLKFLDGLNRPGYHLKKDEELRSEIDEFKFQIVGEKQNINLASHLLLEYFKFKKYGVAKELKNENDREKDITLVLTGEYEVALKVGMSTTKNIGAIQIAIKMKNKPVSHLLSKELAPIFYKNDFRKVYEYLKGFWKGPDKKELDKEKSE